MKENTDGQQHTRLDLEVKTQETEHQFERGITLLENGDLRDAIHVFREVLKDDPGCAEAYYNIGHALYGLGKYSQALGELQVAINLKPDLGYAHHKLGRALLKLRRYEESLAASQQAVQYELDPCTLAWTYYQIGLAYTEQKGFDAAMIAYGKALQFDPTLGFAHLRLGHLYSQEQRFDEAIGEYQAALWLNPKQKRARRLLASSLFAKRQVSRGLKEWIASLF